MYRKRQVMNLAFARIVKAVSSNLKPIFKLRFLRFTPVSDKMNYNASISAAYDSSTPPEIAMYQSRESIKGNFSTTLPVNSVPSEVNFKDLLAMSVPDLRRSVIPASMIDLQNTAPIVVNDLVALH